MSSPRRSRVNSAQLPEPRPDDAPTATTEHASPTGKEEIAETQQRVRTASEDKTKHRKRRAEGDPNDKAIRTKKREVMDLTSTWIGAEANPDHKRIGSPEDEDVITTIRNLKMEVQALQERIKKNTETNMDLFKGINIVANRLARAEKRIR